MAATGRGHDQERLKGRNSTAPARRVRDRFWPFSFRPLQWGPNHAPSGDLYRHPPSVPRLARPAGAATARIACRLESGLVSPILQGAHDPPRSNIAINRRITCTRLNFDWRLEQDNAWMRVHGWFCVPFVCRVTPPLAPLPSALVPSLSQAAPVPGAASRKRSGDGNNAGGRGRSRRPIDADVATVRGGRAVGMARRWELAVVAPRPLDADSVPVEAWAWVSAAAKGVVLSEASLCSPAPTKGLTGTGPCL